MVWQHFIQGASELSCHHTHTVQTVPDMRPAGSMFQKKAIMFADSLAAPRGVESDKVLERSRILMERREKGRRFVQCLRMVCWVAVLAAGDTQTSHAGAGRQLSGLWLSDLDLRSVAI